MKLANKFSNSSPRTRVFVLFAVILLLLGNAVHGQQAPQLSLADLLIGLRSKKVSLPDRNAILTEAVRQRGVTFTVTPEIEKELETTGASPALIEAIRQKAPKPVPPPVAKPVATPVPTPTPPDFSFYQTRGDQNFSRGEYGPALNDYNKSLELKSDNSVAYVGRGKVHFNLKSYELSVKDFDKAVELDPKDSTAYFNRAVSFERLGERKKAMADFEKSAELDPTNEEAKTGLKRLRDLEAADAAAAAAEAARNAPPEFLNLGTLTASEAVKMVTPIYSVVAQRSNIEGRVTVEVELDVEGNVVSAKATSGPQMLRSPAEDAAKRSKFKPGTFNNRPIKAKGMIIYNFSLRPPAR